MALPSITLGSLSVSRFLIGGNPFGGFSHQSLERSREMIDWYTPERIVETLFLAQELGVTACILRGDADVAAVLRSYWDQGGTMVWVAQTDSRADTVVAGAQLCLDAGASACFMHGGVVDHCVAQGLYTEMEAFVQTVRDAHLPVGLAGHVPADFVWAEQSLPVDFYMVCYYNPSDRALVPHHDPEATERYDPQDREDRVVTLATLERPCIHYKIMAAGRLEPEEAFRYATDHMRPSDAVCVGIYTRDDPQMVATDIELLLRGLRRVGQL